MSSSPNEHLDGVRALASSRGLCDLLRAVPILSDLDDDGLERVLRVGRVLELARDAVLFREGDPGDAMYVILRGRIRITKSSCAGERQIAVRRRNDFFGEMAIIDGEPRSASAVAAASTSLLRVSRQDFFDHVLTRGEAVVELLAGVTRRMRRAHEAEETLISELRRKNVALERFNARLERRVRAQTSELRRINRELQALSMRDGLTGLFNRRVFSDVLEQTLARQMEKQSRASLVMLDVDHFKRVNDTHGHQGGDRVLMEVARLVTGLLASGQIFARYGGEEFALISPGGRRRAADKAESIRRAVESHVFPLRDAREAAITVSLGVACCPDDADTPAGLIAAADEALYRAKAEGRNRVIVCGTRN